MNSSVLCDFLISNSSGKTLYFDHHNCPLDLIKEFILRGYDVSDTSEYEIDFWEVMFELEDPEFGSIEGNGKGCGVAFSQEDDQGVWECGEGVSIKEYPLHLGDGEGDGFSPYRGEFGGGYQNVVTFLEGPQPAVNRAYYLA